MLVYTRAGEVLLMERSRPHGFWRSVTGSLQWGESAQAAAARELAEETGLGLAAGWSTCVAESDLRSSAVARTLRACTVHVNREHWFTLELPSRPHHPSQRR